jgi:hypothetical protein
MATCKHCNQEMLHATGCTYRYFIIEGKKYRRNTAYHDSHDRCHDCGIINGNIHHFECDIERCPRCEGQLLSCACTVEALER